MLWGAVFVIALAVGQAPAAPQTQYERVGYPEDVVVDGTGQASRILSGWDAEPGQFPHHISLRMTSAAGLTYACGGSLISRSWVLTAAHCTSTHVFVTVRAGVVHVNTPEFIADTREWYNHPTFNANRPEIVQPNDIAMIKLHTPVTYSPLLQRIRVQPRVHAHRNYDHAITIATGHGRTWTNGPVAQILQWVYLRAISNTQCARLYGTALINSNAICAGFYNVTSQSTCQGDSGGPLIHIENGKPTLIGVISFVAGGDFGCHSGLPAGFIRPGPFHNWFTQISGLDFNNLVEEEPTEPPTEPTVAPTEPTVAPTVPTAAPTEEPTEPPVTAGPTPGPTEPPVTDGPTPGPTEPQPTVPEPTPDPTPGPTEPPVTDEPTPGPTEPQPTEPEPTPGPTPGPTEPPVTDGPTEPPVTVGPTEPGPTEPPVTEPPTTEKPDTEEDEDEEDENEEDEDDDRELSQLLKKLEVKVKVKVKLSKYGHIKHRHNKTITHVRPR